MHDVAGDNPIYRRFSGGNQDKPTDQNYLSAEEEKGLLIEMNNAGHDIKTKKFE